MKKTRRLKERIANLERGQDWMNEQLGMAHRAYAHAVSDGCRWARERDEARERISQLESEVISVREASAVEIFQERVERYSARWNEAIDQRDAAAARLIDFGERLSVRIEGLNMLARQAVEYGRAAMQSEEPLVQVEEGE